MTERRLWKWQVAKRGWKPIRQGLFRIKIKDGEGEYCMVPVWMFTIKTSSESEGDGEEGTILNAMDGSVIDINKGY